MAAKHGGDAGAVFTFRQQLEEIGQAPRVMLGDQATPANRVRLAFNVPRIILADHQLGTGADGGQHRLRLRHKQAQHVI